MNFLLSPLKIIPFFTVVFMMMGGCLLSIGGHPLLPAFFLIPIYYWLVFRPDWLPLWGLMVAGLIYDTLMGNEMGFDSLLLMLSAFLALYIRPFLTSYRFPLIWVAFGIYSFGYLILYGLFHTGISSLFASWIYVVALYPLVARILNHIHLTLQAYV